MKKASLTKDKTPEGKNLYLLSFFGLLRNGCPYEVREDVIQEAVIPDRKKASQSKKSSDKKKGQDKEVQTPTITKRVINIIIDRKGYSCDEDELRRTFGAMYDEILNREHNANEYDDKDGDEVLIPKVDFGMLDDEKTKEIKDFNAGMIQKKEDEVTIPYITNDNKYMDDPALSKEYDTFLFDAHTTLVQFSSGEKHQCSINVFPLNMDMSDTLGADVLVVATDEQGRIRAAMSDWREDGQKAVNIEYEFCTFVIRAEWKRGTFSSTVAVYSTPYGEDSRLNDKVTHVVPTKRTSSFYMRHHAANGNYLNVFPLQLLRNDPQSGLAPAVVMIEDGKERKLHSMDSNTWLSLWYDQSQKKIEVYWAGNSLHLHMEEG